MSLMQRLQLGRSSPARHRRRRPRHQRAWPKCWSSCSATSPAAGAATHGASHLRATQATVQLQRRQRRRLTPMCRSGSSRRSHAPPRPRIPPRQQPTSAQKQQQAESGSRRRCSSRTCSSRAPLQVPTPRRLQHWRLRQARASRRTQLRLCSAASVKPAPASPKPSAPASRRRLQRLRLRHLLARQLNPHQMSSSSSARSSRRQGWMRRALWAGPCGRSLGANIFTVGALANRPALWVPRLPPSVRTCKPPSLRRK